MPTPKTILPLLFLLSAALPFQAQSPYLVRDINTTISFDTSSSSPAGFTNYHNRTFFVATTDASGTELWSTGGNSTSLVADIIPGSSGSSPAGLKVVNDVLLFHARDVDHGIELWMSNGTAVGTRLLLDINPGPSSSQPAAKTIYGNRILFSADDGTNGRELWISDGTSGGTRMVRDITPGASSSFPASFVALGSNIYFSAAGGLWKTDGTQSGTVKVANVPARLLTVAGGLLFFEGSDTSAGWEPWVSDGSEAGTRMVADIIPGPRGSLALNFTGLGFTSLGNQVFFAANDDVHGREMWVSDGTPAGTHLVRDFRPGATGTWDTSNPSIAAFGNRAWFGASDVEHGHELWVTDGTESGTVLFADLVPGTASSSPSTFVVSNGTLFFGASVNTSSSARLWVTDGSAGGMRVIGGVAAGPGVSSGSIAAIDGMVYFAGFTAVHGTEPWVSDGTDAGTRMLANLAADEAPSSSPWKLTATSDLLFFYAKEGTKSPGTNVYEYSLWRSDGTASGTFKLKEASENVTDLTPAGSAVFFSESFYSEKLLMSDGTIEGTRSTDDFMTRFGEGEIKTLFPFGDTLFAGISHPDSDESVLWKTTAAPNALAEELGAHNPYGLIEVAGHYAFYAPTHENTHDRSLWTTDGTRAGTYAIVPDLAADYQSVSPLVNAAGTIFFLKEEESDQNAKLWKSDGTMDGTTVVRELPEVGVHRTSIAAAGRRVFIGSRETLWTSDGTESGTIKVATLEGSSPFNGFNFVPVGHRVLFTIQNEPNGFELWSSDGTQSGTIKLARNAFGLVSIEGLFYFEGTDEQHGSEVWTTDGTAEGTKLLIDLNPGPASSRPGGFVKMGNTIYFVAYTDATGRELWALPLTEPRLSISDARASEGDAASSVVRFNVSLASAPEQVVTVDYATANSTALAGQDYEAAAGTLTFLAGETTKVIEVRVMGDSSAENNETFFIALNNANGARIVKGEATGIIDDEDQMADLSVAPLFYESGSSLDEAVRVSNLGPRAATDVVVRVTTTPSYGGQRCSTCSIPQIAVGESMTTAYGYGTPFEQIYLSAVATARQGDPQTSSNSATWTVSYYRMMAMNAAYLTTGATATVTAISHVSTAAATSSDPSVVAISSAVTKLSDDVVTFTVTALKPGTSELRLDGHEKPLLATVVGPGLTPRWPGGMAMSIDASARRFDQPVFVTVTPTGVAPLTAATATGTVMVTAAGQELTRRAVGDSEITFPLYLPSLGRNNLQITYGGDANFLPQTVDHSVFVHKGIMSLTGTLVRAGDTVGMYTLAIEATGSPIAAPTGVVSVVHGTTELARVTLQPSGGEVSRAEVTLTNLPKYSTLTLNYFGDALYLNGTQQIRSAEARRRSARH